MDYSGKKLATRKAKDEFITHLHSLIKINTSSPPGNETRAAKYIAGVFKNEKIQCRVLESSKGRGNIAARITGDGSLRPLLLMGRLDTPGAGPEKWDCDPFKGIIKDGFLWGRGAMDQKMTTALWMMIMRIIMNAGIKLKRDIIFLANAGGQGQDDAGIGWILKNHPDIIDAEAALKDGGGPPVTVTGKNCFTYQNAEKGRIWLRLKAGGGQGHASLSGNDNAILKITDAIYAVMTGNYGTVVTDSFRVMVQSVAGEQNLPLRTALSLLQYRPFLKLFLAVSGDSEISRGIGIMVKNTAFPTIIRGGTLPDRFPADAFFDMDIRVVPGSDLNDIIDTISRRAGEAIDIEVLEATPPGESPADHPLAESIKKTIRARHPGALIIPILQPGTTDASHLRRRGMAVYGLSPLLPGETLLPSGSANERISLKSLEYGLEMALDTVLDYCL